MRIIRYRGDDGSRYGLLTEGLIRTLEGSPYGQFTFGSVVGDAADFTLLAPSEPTKVVCVGRNYATHVEEMGRTLPSQPFIFLTAPNAVIGPHQPVIRPPNVKRFDYEGELAVVVGREASRIQERAWRDYVLGFTCGNDMTVRDWQESDGQWARAKSSDTLCPLGPWIETEVVDPEALALRTYVNGEVRQDSSTSDLVFGIGELLTFITRYMTLMPGDVVLTGTPGGVGPVDDGDVVEVDIEDVGRLRNPIKRGRP